MPSVQSPRYWFVIPAAGIGARMDAGKPKQYLMLGEKKILEHTLSLILSWSQVAGVVVALSPADVYWESLNIFQNPLVHTTVGGRNRADSVLNGLKYLADLAQAQDWVLVHDAARPCVTLASIEKLCDELSQSKTGGILAVPVSDTLKQVDDHSQIQITVDRKPLWQAQTPQMFRYGILHHCLTQALTNNENITDESSAVELCGYQSKVVEGRSDNIKITRPDDLLLAEFILRQQARNL